MRHERIEQLTHTPGPWKFEKQDDGRSDGFIRAGEQYSGAVHPPAVARICKRGLGRLDESVANARLIAAAPELLAACKAMLLDRTRDDHTSRIAAAAIAKAEGR
jgi:hypothetical protein